MRIIETKVYTIDEHPNKDLCFDYIRANWHNLNEHSVNEIIDSLKALQKVIGGYLDYSICQSSARGEFIRFKNYDEDALKELNADEYGLTGVCWDYDIIKSMQKYGDVDMVLQALHEDTDYIYSDAGLTELCVDNKYEFNDKGEYI